MSHRRLHLFLLLILSAFSALSAVKPSADTPPSLVLSSAGEPDNAPADEGPEDEGPEDEST